MTEIINLQNPFLKVLLPALAILVVYLIAKYRMQISLKNDLKLQWPPLGQLLLWLALAIIYMLVTNYFLNWRGPWNFNPWQQQPLYISILRVLAVSILGPIAEEMVFRGLIFYKLKQLTKLNLWILIIIIAAVWAFIHVDYTWEVRTVIFVEGILLGAALLKSNSLVTPILMHISWNLYAIW